MPATTAAPRAAAALSSNYDTRTAVREVVAQLEEHLVDSCDLVLLFGSYHHRAAFADAGEIVRSALRPMVMVGTTAESVLANAVELEGRSGIAAIALRIPGATIRGFRLPGNDASLVGDGAPERLRSLMHVDASHAATLLFGDPFSTPMPQILAALGPVGGLPAVTTVGGMSSGASQPGMNALILDESTLPAGAVGVTLSGDIRVDCLVSQGCRPIGEPMVITKAQGNVLQELGGRPAMQAAQAMAESLPESLRPLLGKGLLLGLAVDEYKERFGRGDFVVRGLLGADRNSGAMAVGDAVRVGQTVQFHVRDDRTADEDLRLLLDGQQLDSTPVATLLFTCNGRGTRLFPQPHHDAALAHQRLGQAPLAGFFAAGEIGPVGPRPFLHGHTAVCAVVRA